MKYTVNFFKSIRGKETENWVVVGGELPIMSEKGSYVSS